MVDTRDDGWHYRMCLAALGHTPARVQKPIAGAAAPLFAASIGTLPLPALDIPPLADHARCPKDNQFVLRMAERAYGKTFRVLPYQVAGGMDAAVGALPQGPMPGPRPIRGGASDRAPTTTQPNVALVASLRRIFRSLSTALYGAAAISLAMAWMMPALHPAHAMALLATGRVAITAFLVYWGGIQAFGRGRT